MVAIAISIDINMKIKSGSDIQSKFNERPIVSGEIKIMSNVDFSRNECVVWTISIELYSCGSVSSVLIERILMKRRVIHVCNKNFMCG